MYCFLGFILLMSLEGLKAENNTALWTSTLPPSLPTTASPNMTTRNMQPTNSGSKPMSTHMCTTNPGLDQSGNNAQGHFLINLKDKKEMVLWFMIAALLLFSLLLLVITLILACKRPRVLSSDAVKSSSSTKRNRVNGGPSETDLMLKDRRSVTVEIEARPDESEEMGEAAAEACNQVSTEENENPAAETAPTQGVKESGKTDFKIEDSEKGE